MSTWYIRDRGRVIGPFGTEQLLEMREAGQVQGYVEVSPDRRIWKALDLVPELGSRPVVGGRPAGGRQEGTRGGRREVEELTSPDPESVAQTDRSKFLLVVGSVVALVLVGGLTVAGALVLRNRNPDPVADKGGREAGESGSEARAKESDSKPSSPEQVIAAVEPSVALVKGNRGSGTGFMVRKGIVATNAHVVAKQFTDRVKLHFSAVEGAAGEGLSVKIIHFDPKRDLALLTTDSPIAPLRLANDYRFARGQDVLAIGNPGFGAGNLINAVSRGTMSSQTTLEHVPYYQVSMSINPGNSGGPVLNQSGQVIGVVAARATKQEGLAFVIPVKDLDTAIMMSQKRSVDEIEQVVSFHRATVAYTWLREAGKLYRNGLNAYTTMMAEAAKKGINPYEGLRAASSVIDQKIAFKNQVITDDLKPNLSSVLNDPRTDTKVRDHIRGLWESYIEMKRLFDKPSGTPVEYIRMIGAVSDKFEQHAEALSAEYGLDDD